MKKPEKARTNLRVVSSRSRAVATSASALDARVAVMPPASGADAPLTELRGRDGSIVQLLTPTLDIEPAVLDRHLPSVMSSAIQHSQDFELTVAQRHELLLLLQSGRIQAECEKLFERHYVGDIESEVDDSKPRRIVKHPRPGGEGKLIGKVNGRVVEVIEAPQMLSFFLRSIHRKCMYVRHLIIIGRDLARAAEHIAWAMYVIGYFKGEDRTVRGEPLYMRAAAEEELQRQLDAKTLLQREERSNQARENAKKRAGITNPMRDKIVRGLRAHKIQGSTLAEALDAMQRCVSADGIRVEFRGDDVHFVDDDAEERRVTKLKTGSKVGKTLSSWWADAGRPLRRRRTTAAPDLRGKPR